MDRAPIRGRRQECGIFEVKRRFALGELQLLSKLENPTSNQAQSVAGPPPMGLANVPMVAPLPGGSVRVPRKSKGFRKNWQKIAEYELEIWELFLKSATHTALAPRKNFSWGQTKNRSLHRRAR